MKAVFAYNYNAGPSSKSSPASLHSSPPLILPPPPEVTTPTISELTSGRKDAFRQIKKMFRLA